MKLSSNIRGEVDSIYEQFGANWNDNCLYPLIDINSHYGPVSTKDLFNDELCDGIEINKYYSWVCTHE